ncbi:g431 [Coccomyxa elongata]
MERLAKECKHLVQSNGRATLIARDVETAAAAANPPPAPDSIHSRKLQPHSPETPHAGSTAATAADLMQACLFTAKAAAATPGSINRWTKGYVCDPLGFETRTIFEGSIDKIAPMAAADGTRMCGKALRRQQLVPQSATGGLKPGAEICLAWRKLLALALVRTCVVERL